MSSHICPDCRLFALNFETKPTTCEICGWTGVLRFRRKFTPYGFKEKSKQTTKLLKLREENKLTFIRVETEGSDEKLAQLTDYLIDLFQINEIETNNNRLFFYIKRRIKKEELKELNSLKNIKSVFIF